MGLFPPDLELKIILLTCRHKRLVRTAAHRVDPARAMSPAFEFGANFTYDNREISLHVQRRIRVDVGHVFGIKTNPYLKIKYTFEIFHQTAVKL